MKKKNRRMPDINDDLKGNVSHDIYSSVEEELDDMQEDSMESPELEDPENKIEKVVNNMVSEYRQKQDNPVFKVNGVIHVNLDKLSKAGNSRR